MPAGAFSASKIAHPGFSDTKIEVSVCKRYIFWVPEWHPHFRAQVDKGGGRSNLTGPAGHGEDNRRGREHISHA